MENRGRMVVNFCCKTMHHGIKAKKKCHRPEDAIKKKIGDHN